MLIKGMIQFRARNSIPGNLWVDLTYSIDQRKVKHVMNPFGGSNYTLRISYAEVTIRNIITYAEALS